MTLTTSQRLERLRVRTAELVCWRERESFDVTPWTVAGTTLAVGDRWPEDEGVLPFSTDAVLPDHWPLDQAWIYLDLGGESLLHFTAGDERQTWGLDPVHRHFRTPWRRFGIEAGAVPRLPFGEPVNDPRLLAARAYWRDEAVHALHLLLTQLADSVAELGDHACVPHLLDAGEAALAGLDWPSGTADYLSRIAGTEQQRAVWQLPAAKPAPAALSEGQSAQAQAVHDALRARLAGLRDRFPPEGQLAICGHAHIDLAWLWPYGETRRKLRRTFSTTANLLDAHPDFTFNQSTAAYYHQLETDDPALLDRIRAAVKRGQWEPVGGMWVETDAIMPQGESLVRQVLYGQRYFEREFGARHDTAWLPDCFGFSAALPQILVQGGMTRFFTTKMNWSESNRFPHDIFQWEGLDGSRVLAHSFNNPVMSYNGTVEPDVLLGTWKNFSGKTRHDESLITIGYGDGGGGPSEDMLDRWQQLDDFPALPELRATRVDGFFDRLADSVDTETLPVWSGEMYLELHRGTLTTQGRIKRLHRQAEQALLSAEATASLAHLLGAGAPDSLESVWRVLLKNQFHDILPGSSITEVNVEAEAELADTVAAADSYQQQALDALAGVLPQGGAQGLIAVNPTLDARPFEAELDGAALAAPVTLPPLSVSVLDRAALVAAPGLQATAERLENAHLRVTLAPDGTIASLLHKPTGREALSGRGNQIWAYPMDKARHYDAWDIEEDYETGGIEVSASAPAELIESGPHRAAIRVRRQFRDSSITQTYRLWADGTRLEIVTELDWHDRRVMLRSRTPVAVRSEHATYECAFGVVRRPTHRNTSWDAAKFEVPAHRFADLAEPGFGVAVLNDGRYGHSASGDTLGLTLLRAPVFPDPLADEGAHNFTYALMPHAGDWQSGGVRQAALALNAPLPLRAADGLRPCVIAPLAVTGAKVALAALKPAEDAAGLVLRVYEPAGGRGPCAVALPAGWTLSEPLNLMEDPMPGAGATLGPFELRSWRLAPGGRP